MRVRKIRDMFHVIRCQFGHGIFSGWIRKDDPGGDGQEENQQTINSKQ